MHAESTAQPNTLLDRAERKARYRPSPGAIPPSVASSASIPLIPWAIPLLEDGRAYCFKNGGLEETVDGWTFKYTFWGEKDFFGDQFGAWATPPDGAHYSFPFSPAVRLFSEDGKPFEREGTLRRQAFSLWADHIPLPIRQFVGGFTEGQWPLLKILKAEPLFAEVATRSPVFTWFVCTWSNFAKLPTGEQARLARRIATEKRSMLLSRLCRLPLGRSIVSVLDRVTGTPDDDTFLEDFILVITHPLKRLSLRHIAECPPDFVHSLSALPAWLLSHRLAKLISPEHTQGLLAIALVFDLQADSRAKNALKTWLSHCRDRASLDRFVDDWSRSVLISGVRKETAADAMLAIRDDPVKWPVLERCPCPSRGLVQDLRQIPGWALPGNITRFIGAKETRALARHLSAFSSHLETQHSKDVAQKMRAITNKAELRRFLAQLSFPPAPFEGNAYLTPITRETDLVAESESMEHCVQTYAPEIFAGDYYVYRWTANERASIGIKRKPWDRGRWQLDQIRCQGNAVASRETVVAIYGELRKNGVSVSSGKVSL